MKRTGNLFERIIERDNLRLAFLEALRGKRDRRDAQRFANGYLGGLDRLIKEELRIRGYIRYMDDLALWSDARSCLRSALTIVETYLRDELGLEPKPSPCLNRTAHGMDFLGCRLYRRHLILSRRSSSRFRHKLIRLERLFAGGLIDAAQLQQRATALVAFARSAGMSSWRFRTAVLQELAVGGPRARTG